MVSVTLIKHILRANNLERGKVSSLYEARQKMRLMRSFRKYDKRMSKCECHPDLDGRLANFAALPNCRPKCLARKLANHGFSVAFLHAHQTKFIVVVGRGLCGCF